MFKIKLVVIAVLFAVCAPVQALDKSSSFVVASYNIDTNVTRTEEGFIRDSNPDWRVMNRMPLICNHLRQIIKECSPAVIQIQEGRKFIARQGDLVDSVTPLVEFFESEGYQVRHERYNPSDRAFSYITAVKREYTIESVESKYFTIDGLITNHETASRDEAKTRGFGDEWERSAFVTTLRDGDGQLYHVFNVHLSVVFKTKIESCRLLQQWSAEYIEKNKDARIVITGDFNTFSDDIDNPQIALVTAEDVLKHGTHPLKLWGTDKDIDFSFIYFPYDLGIPSLIAPELQVRISALAGMDPESARAGVKDLFGEIGKAVGGVLDHVFYRGFDKVNTYLWPAYCQGEGPADYTEAGVKKYMMETYSSGPAFASDHQPLIAVLQVSSHK